MSSEGIESRNILDAIGQRAEYSYFGFAIVVTLVGLGMNFEGWGRTLCNIAILAYLLHYGAMRAYGIEGQRWSRVLRIAILFVYVVGVGLYKWL